jgi:carbonic anhydrase
MSLHRRLSRREFVAAAGLAAGALETARRADGAEDERPAKRDPDSVLASLLEGNKRFSLGRSKQPRRAPKDFLAAAEGQNPLAVVVACSDSRVTPELLFDLGVGDLFVIRVAGNVISGTGPVLKGSIEYAVAELGVRLIMVLGHSKCGAIKAAVKHIDAQDSPEGAIGDLVKIVAQAAAGARGTFDERVESVTRANVLRGVERLQGLGPIIAPAVKKKTVKVVGATYDLSNARVSLVE